MFLNEKLHIVFDTGKRLLLLKRIINYIDNILYNLHELNYDKTDEDNSKYFNIEDRIPKYLNNFQWLNNDFEIRIHNKDYGPHTTASFWQDDCVIINNKLSRAIFNIYIDFDEPFDSEVYMESLHHEFLHAYEHYNKLIKNLGGLSYYEHYGDLFKDYPFEDFNLIMQYVYICVKEESQAFLQNFYDDFKLNKKFRKSNIYNFVANTEDLNRTIDNLSNLQKKIFITKCGDVIYEVLGISKNNPNYFNVLKRKLNLRLENIKIKMDKIGTGIINGEYSLDEKLDISYHLQKNRLATKNKKF